VNRGNIGLADGSVQTTDSSFLHQLLVQSGVATNRLALP
jgi:prepilin-type processing-associated H-X9-DG protein